MPFIVNQATLRSFANLAAEKIQKDPRTVAMHLKAYAVPRGGIPAALAIGNSLNRKMRLVDTPEEADIIIDDLIDSGRTSQRPEFAGKPFYALIDKRSWDLGDEWVVWPWEQTAEKGIEDHIQRLIQFAGDDPKREGLLETPARVAKAWLFWCSGYERDPMEVLKTFQDGAEGCDEMVVVKDIPFYTHCEHHLTPFFGTATIAYLPAGKVVGLSKLSRVLDIFARRLQVQERLTTQVADALVAGLEPKGVGVVIKARHLCMESRGVCQQGHHTVTSALRGAIRDESSARAEFLALAR
jgi:GTP cyclohydrolase I